MGLILFHGIHLLLVTWVFRCMDGQYFIVRYGYLIVASPIVLRSPLYLRRPVAALLYCGAVLFENCGLKATPGMEWFVPFFSLKLLVCYLVKEAPFRPEEATRAKPVA